MGCASSCKPFESLSTALEWVAKVKLVIPNIIHILDEFRIIADSLTSCGKHLNRFLQCCDELDVPMAPEKTEGPAQVLMFAGIKLESNHIVICTRLGFLATKLRSAQMPFISFLVDEKEHYTDCLTLGA